LEAALNLVDRSRSVSARIHHEVYLFDKRLIGSGNYWQQRDGSDLLSRLELKIQLGDRTSSLLQVCDGRFLWTKRNLVGEPELSRVDIDRVLRRLEEAEPDSLATPQGEWPGLGGLPRLIRALRDAFEFSTPAEPGQWGQARRPVWRLQGHWTAKRLAQLLPEQKEAIEAGKPADLSRLPAHLPDQVVVILGQDDYFPYRIEYRRTLTDARPTDAGPHPSRALVVMQLYDVMLNVPIDPKRFLYSPADLPWNDETERFLSGLE